MKKSYSFLEKKLQEIEQAHAQNEDIKPRIEFLNHLISDEVSHHPPDSIPRPLLSISEQLTRIKSGYLKGKDYRTTTSSPDSCFSDDDKCDHQGDDNDPMPELETVEASPVIPQTSVINYEANEKSTGLKIYWCGCLIIMMTGAVFLVMGAILMLSFCGCSGSYYNNDTRLQYAPGFMTPT